MVKRVNTKNLPILKREDQFLSTVNPMQLIRVLIQNLYAKKTKASRASSHHTMANSLKQQ